MYQNKQNRRGLLNPIGIPFILSAIAAMYVMILVDSDNIYSSLIVLPIAFTLSSLLFPGVYDGISHSPLTILIVAGYFIRLVICPVLFCVSGYEAGFGSSSVGEEEVIKSVVLFSLEALVVFGVASVKNRYRRDLLEYRKEISFREYNVTLANSCIVLLSVFLLFAYFAVPALKSIYIFFPNANIKDLVTLRWDNETIVSRGTSSRILYSLFVFLWQFLRMPLMAYFMCLIYRRHHHKKLYLWLSMLCIVIPSIFLSGDNITPFIGALLGILIVKRLYGSLSDGPIKILEIVFIGLFVLVFFSKVTLFKYYGGTNIFSTISQTLNAYFPGVNNAAIGFAKVQTTSKFDVLRNDLLYAIPFNQSLFGVSGDRFTRIFGLSIGSTGSIPPFGYQLAFYFGIPISVIITGLIVDWAYKYEIRSFETEDFWTYFVNMYFSVYTGISISCYSFSTFLSAVIGTFIPLWIIIVLGRKKNREYSTAI